MFIASIDIGTALTKAAGIARGAAQPRSTRFISARQPDGDIVWDGGAYALGTAPLPAGAVLPGNDLYQFLTAVAVARLGVQEGRVDLNLFVPLTGFHSGEIGIQGSFRHAGPTVAIQFEEQAREWRYYSITVWPQGVGAAACLMLDERGRVVDALPGETLIIDVGHGSLDTLRITDGDFNPERMAHRTWEDEDLLEAPPPALADHLRTVYHGFGGLERVLVVGGRGAEVAACLADAPLVGPNGVDPIAADAVGGLRLKLMETATF